MINQRSIMAALMVGIVMSLTVIGLANLNTANARDTTCGKATTCTIIAKNAKRIDVDHATIELVQNNGGGGGTGNTTVIENTFNDSSLRQTDAGLQAQIDNLSNSAITSIEAQGSNTTVIEQPPIDNTTGNVTG